MAQDHDFSCPYLFMVPRASLARRQDEVARLELAAREAGHRQAAETSAMRRAHMEVTRCACDATASDARQRRRRDERDAQGPHGGDSRDGTLVAMYLPNGRTLVAMYQLNGRKLVDMYQPNGRKLVDMYQPYAVYRPYKPLACTWRLQRMRKIRA